MIAAGHPRLTFEMSAFLANMPHHWDDRAEKAREDYAAHVWAVGQIASTQAALRSAGGPGQGGRSSPRNGPLAGAFRIRLLHMPSSLVAGQLSAENQEGGPGGETGPLCLGDLVSADDAALGRGRSRRGLRSLAGVDRVVKLMDDPTPDAVRRPRGSRCGRPRDAAAPGWREEGPLRPAGRGPHAPGDQGPAGEELGRGLRAVPSLPQRLVRRTRDSRSRLPPSANCFSSATRSRTMAR